MDVFLRGAGERAPAFTQEELEKLVEGVLPLYGRLYGRPEVSAHQKRAHWHAIAKEVRTLGVYNRRSTHCRKRWEDLRLWAQKISETQLGKRSQCSRGAHWALTPVMRRILAVAYPDLDGRLKAAQQSQGGCSTYDRRLRRRSRSCRYMARSKAGMICSSLSVAAAARFVELW
ncbi:hypothetical protein NDU88_002248 [Pleurodeles waltl]|uniref:Myb-like domain-containing protein n=1 Tax=Pleurodeles waltl TaxID=8319 RepID=A0AAV7TLF1_PLEWA|nr:hypothetical protein NDU88_002248 [Pleurodeles waltl]